MFRNASKNNYWKANKKLISKFNYIVTLKLHLRLSFLSELTGQSEMNPTSSCITLQFFTIADLLFAEVKKESGDTSPSHMTAADDSGISSVGSPTPPVLSPPVTSFADYYAPTLAMPRLIRPEIPNYLQPALWSYPYFLPPPPPLYPSPYLPYLMPPLYPPPSESYLIDLSVKREPDSLTEQWR